MNAHEEVLARIVERKIIAIVRGLEPAILLDLAQALYAGGVDLIEVTFPQNDPDRWRETAGGIRALASALEGKLMVGAGTVVTTQQLMMAYDAGARYIITPNMDRRIIQDTRKLGLASLPGAFTPSEIAAAYDAGADMVKVFPAGSLGASYIKAVKAPLSHVPLMAVGGINEKNAGDFLRAGAAGVGVGGNLVQKDWLLQGKAEEITTLAKEYVRVIKEASLWLRS